MLIAGCAQGASDMSNADALRLPDSTVAGSGGTGAAGGASGAGGLGGGGGTGGTGGTAGTPMFDGDPCAQGQTEACVCEGSAAMGERMCVADASSPTGGAFSECRNCPPAPDGGLPMGGASGMTAGGMGGAGAGGTSGGAGGMSGGAGGMSGGAGGMSGCMCMDALACCKDDGTCGVGVPGLCF
jgi:hypothetical protein